MKKIFRLRRCYNFRKNFFKFKYNRLSLYRSNNNIFCQVFSICNSKVLLSVSSVNLNFKKYIFLNFGKTLKISICSFIGKCLAYNCFLIGIYNIVFDCSGYKYHGCIKSLADMSRKHGLNF